MTDDNAKFKENAKFNPQEISEKSETLLSLIKKERFKSKGMSLYFEVIAPIIESTLSGNYPGRISETQLRNPFHYDDSGMEAVSDELNLAYYSWRFALFPK
jgi:hypothetical protein